MKQKMLDEVAEAIIKNKGAPLSISEHEAIVSEIKNEAAKAHTEMLEARGMLLCRMFLILKFLTFCSF